MISHVKELILSAWLYRVLRALYAILFLYAGFNKLFDPGSFAIVIDAFGLVPDILIMPIAVALPLLEILAAIGLIVDVRSSLTVVGGLLLFFLAVVGYGIWMGLDIDCGCFGLGDPEGEAYKSLRPAFYRNIALLIGIAYLYYVKKPKCPVRKSGPALKRGGEWPRGVEHP